MRSDESLTKYVIPFHVLPFVIVFEVQIIIARSKEVDKNCLGSC